MKKRWKLIGLDSIKERGTSNETCCRFACLSVLKQSRVQCLAVKEMAHRRIFLPERIRSGAKGGGLLNPCCIWRATAFYQIVLLGEGVLGAHPLNPPDLKHNLTASPSSSSDSCKQTYLPTKSGHQICDPKSCSVSGLATGWGCNSVAGAGLAAVYRKWGPAPTFSSSADGSPWGHREGATRGQRRGIRHLESQLPTCSCSSLGLISLICLQTEVVYALLL